MNIFGKAAKKLTTNRSSEEHGAVRVRYLLFWALVLLFGQLNANAQGWNLDDISIPIHGADSAISTGSTVFGISHESPDGKYLVYPYYIDGIATSNHSATPVPADLIIVNRETKESWIADRVTLNNHNGANHIWLGNSMFAYHKQHLWTFSVYDLSTRTVIIDDIYGQLPHSSDGSFIYYTIQNNQIRIPGMAARPAEDQGLWKYDINARTETQLVPLQDVVRSLASNPSYNIMTASDNTSRNVNHADPSPTGDTVTFLVKHSGTNYQMLVDSDGSNFRAMDVRPFHALWFDEESILAASRKSSTVIKHIKRTNLNGIGIELLGGHGAHEGGSPDREWYGGEGAPEGAYSAESDGNTRVYLYKRGQRATVATLGKWDSNVTWSKVAHANPAFSGDSNRYFYLRGPLSSSDETNFNLHYVNLESYKKTITRYCAAGEPYYTHRETEDDRYIKSVSVTQTDGTNQKVLIPNLTLNKFPEHGYQYLYYVSDSGNVVTPGDEVTISISASEKSRNTVIRGYVDWNQDFDFDETGETPFTQGSANMDNPDNRSFSKTFTVPMNALTGDTLMRVRFSDATFTDPGSCGSDNRTTTYDLPIKVGGTNACVDADMIEANGDIGDSDHAFDDDSGTVWSAHRRGAGVWVKKCFATSQNLGGVELDYESSVRRFKFDIEILDAVNGLWIKALENRRSLGDTDLNTEKHYFPEELTKVSAAAIRYVGYGSDTNYWSNTAEVTPISSSSLSATLMEDAFVSVGDCGNHGSDNRLVAQRYDKPGSGGETVEFRNDIYLKFGIDNLPASVNRATLRLKVRKVPGGQSYNSLHLVTDNDWTQESITGRDLPSIGSLINAFSIPGRDHWLEVDVTSQVNDAKAADSNSISLRLSLSHERRQGVWYHSSEASDPENRPQLTYVKGTL